VAARLTPLAAAALLALPAIAGAQGAASLRGFLVYFDLDSAELTQGGASLVRDFVEFYSPEHVSRVVVVGHADTSGAAARNDFLSRLRAERVAEELVRLGLEPRVISVEARGEAQPALPTGDGVSEPLNRRAEIVYLK
jgi:outer membrane protein OmpA-like peptidoglycan-associated protein